MRGLSLLVVLGVSLGVAQAQPAGSAAPAAGSAAPAAVPAPAADPTPPPAPPPNPAPPAAGAATPAAEPVELRRTCVEAMNKNEGFARSIIQKAIDTDRVSVKAMCADVDTVKTHQEAVAQVEENQRHVIGAYAAMWVIAVVFLGYLLQRQRRLKAEIAQLRHDLNTASRDGKGEK